MSFWICAPTLDNAKALPFSLSVKGVGDTDYSDSVMVAFMVSGDTLPEINTIWPDDSTVLSTVDHHVTLVYLGSATDLKKAGIGQDVILEKLRSFAEENKPVSGKVNGWGRFNGDDADAVYLNFDAPDLPAFRQDLIESLGNLLQVPASHGYTPHITLAYVPKDEPVDMEMPLHTELDFDTITLAWRGKYYDIVLGEVVKGGPGSGNHGHAGRPGERGGSTPKGTMRLPKLKLAPNDGKRVDVIRMLLGKGGEFYQDDPILKDMLTYATNRGELTPDVLEKIGKDAATGFYLEKQASRLKDKVVTTLAEKAGLTYGEANEFVKQWAYSSNDNDMRSLGIQEVAADLFGAPLTDWQNSRIDEVQGVALKTMQSLIDERIGMVPAHNLVLNTLFDVATDKAEPLYLWQREELLNIVKGIEQGDIHIDSPYDALRLLDQSATAAKTKIRKAVEAMYQTTQDRLKELGVSEVRGYRGAVLTGDFESGKAQMFQTSPLTSWSLDTSVARDFAEPTTYEPGVITTAIIPAERIFSYPATGNGCLTEFEIVAIGGTDKLRIHHVANYP